MLGPSTTPAGSPPTRSATARRAASTSASARPRTGTAPRRSGQRHPHRRGRRRGPRFPGSACRPARRGGCSRRPASGTVRGPERRRRRMRQPYVSGPGDRLPQPAGPVGREWKDGGMSEPQQQRSSSVVGADGPDGRGRSRRGCRRASGATPTATARAATSTEHGRAAGQGHADRHHDQAAAGGGAGGAAGRGQPGPAAGDPPASINELEDGLAPELREELERLTLPFDETPTPVRRRAADRPGPAGRLAGGAVPRHPDRAVRAADGRPRAARGDARAGRCRAAADARAGQPGRSSRARRAAPGSISSERRTSRQAATRSPLAAPRSNAAARSAGVPCVATSS